VAFILTNGRPDRVHTYSTLRKCGYTGPIVLLVDDQDKTKEEYVKRYPHETVIFNKEEIAKTFDNGDNFKDMRAIIYARNAAFEVAKDLGITYFIELDDDYTNFNYRFDEKLNYKYSSTTNLDKVFKTMLEFLKNTPGMSSLAMCQNGDYMGGEEGTNASRVMLKRKAMNSFICSTERPFKFVGRVNEDVNTYTRLANTGLLVFSTNQVSLQQKQTQTNAGGMTEMYLDSGTYVKSFYSVMYQPSSVKVGVLRGQANSRMHHNVSWKHSVPKILRESVKK